MADDTTAPFRYRNPDGQGSVVCGWTKQGQLYLRPEGAYPGSAAIVARDHAWELAKYIACDLPGGLAAALNSDAGDPAALLQQRDALMAENIELKARLMPHVAEPEPLTEEEVW
jgi:hypothetical protein